jgi:N6-L-threonylcarbamoyladenine synthase
MHGVYGGVVPELASRDHVRRVVPLAAAHARASRRHGGGPRRDRYTRVPGLAGALLVGASVASALGYALGKPAIGVHHLEGHLLSPLLAEPKPAFPFVALLVSGGHSQLFEVQGVGRYRSSATPKTTPRAKRSTRREASRPRLSGGPALARLAETGRDGASSLPRPMLDSGDLDMSFSGLKTAVLTLVRAMRRRGALDDAPPRRHRARISARGRRRLVAKALAALERTGHSRLVVAVRRGRESRAARAARHGARRSAAAKFTFRTSRSAPTTAR